MASLRKEEEGDFAGLCIVFYHCNLVPPAMEASNVNQGRMAAKNLIRSSLSHKVP
jgi:hypothetical protein